LSSSLPTPAGCHGQTGATFAGWPKVAHVQLDSAWVKRFDAFLRIGQAGRHAARRYLRRRHWCAVTFNTIRLQILAHAAEIEVAR
jgi:cell division transport system permease protein